MDAYIDSDEDKDEAIDGDKKKKLFAKELRCMMYGFGDERACYQESIDLLGELVNEFISDLVSKAMELGKVHGKIHVEDIVFLIRRDQRKYSRMKELLTMNEELKKARKAFDEGNF